MRQVIAFCVLSSVVFFSCKSQSSDTGPVPANPKEYSEKIADLEESLAEPLLKAEAEIKVRGDKGDFAGMAQSAKAMEDTVELRIHTLKKIDPVGKGGEDFKTVSVRYFEYIKSIYTSYKNIAEAKDEEAKKVAADKMAAVINAQPGVLTNLKTAQDKFAAENAFAVDAQ